MNCERATGVVLRTRPLTDTSLIVHWLTGSLGRLATVAKGARRNRSPFRGQLDLFYLAELSFARSRRSELHTLREVKVVETNPGLRQDLALLQQASYCALLLEQTTEAEAPLGALFDQFTGLLRALPEHAARPQTIFAFEMKLLDGLGLKPNLAEMRLSAGARQLLERMAELEWDAVFRLRLSAAQAEEIRQFLHGFLVYHLEKIPAGRNAALGENGPVLSNN
jgi:DNA repair protein RecO (recombination protein O)